eukprot:UN01126
MGITKSIIIYEIGLNTDAPVYLSNGYLMGI